MMEIEAFPNYTQLKPRLPALVWWIFRGLTLLLTLFVIYLLFVRPDTGLVVFWKILIPLLPLSFAVIPGVWRNICPMALLNQLPRTLGFSRANTLSDFLRKAALYISVISFIVFVFFRHPVLNHDGFIVGLILLLALVLAFVGGVFLRDEVAGVARFVLLLLCKKLTDMPR